METRNFLSNKYFDKKSNEIIKKLCSTRMKFILVYNGTAHFFKYIIFFAIISKLHHILKGGLTPRLNLF